MFNTGSVAKQITAHLLIRATRDHALTLDQTVTSLLPRFRLADVTVADLIQHHGGVRDAESMLSLAGFRDLDHYTADDLLELAYRQRQRAVPPGQFLYSNTGYLLLAEILCHVHSTSLQAIADQQVFTPLGMTSTTFQADPRDVIPAAASSYQPTPAGWTRTQRPVALPGPGSLWSTSADIDRGSATCTRTAPPATGCRSRPTSLTGPATIPPAPTGRASTPSQDPASKLSSTTATNRDSPPQPTSPRPACGSRACPTTRESPPTTSPQPPSGNSPTSKPT